MLKTLLRYPTVAVSAKQIPNSSKMPLTHQYTIHHMPLIIRAFTFILKTTVQVEDTACY